MSHPVIKVEALCKNYFRGNQEIPVLKGLDFEIGEREYVSLMGPSGSGKTTLLNILGCLDVPSSGNYYLNNLAVSGFSEDELSKVRNKEIGFVFQQFNLLPQLTALQNVELPLIYAGMGKKERRDRAVECLESVSLQHRMSHKPSALSGGQCQRVAIARALVNSPSMLLADEPTGNLDSETAEEIMGIFKSLNDAGHVIVMVTHEESIARQTKRVIHFKDGKVDVDNKNER